MRDFWYRRGNMIHLDTGLPLIKEASLVVQSKMFLGCYAWLAVFVRKDKAMYENVFGKMFSTVEEAKEEMIEWLLQLMWEQPGFGEL